MLPAGERPVASGPSSPNSAHEIVELVVLTAEEHFLATMREAVGGATRLWHVSAPDKVSDLLLAGEVGILVLDGATLPGSNANFIDQLKRQFPELVILFAGTREDETRLTSLISNGAVYRFIHKPLSSARARLFVQAAVRKHEDPRSTMVLPAMIKPRRRHPDLALIGGGAALALLAGIGIWLGSRHAATPPPAATAIAEDAQLRQAAEALAANRLIAPPGDNALELYLARLARAPNDATARAGLAEVHERLLARAENALLEERLDDTATAIEDARRSGVESGRIAFLSAQLTKARNQPKAAAAPRPRPAAVETQRDEGLAQTLRSAAERLDQGRLLDPDADNALFYLRRAIAIDPADLGVQQTKRALAARLLLDARTAMQARDFDKSNRLLQAAAGIAAQSDIDAARTALTAMRSEAPRAAATAGASGNIAPAGGAADAARGTAAPSNGTAAPSAVNDGAARSLASSSGAAPSAAAAPGGAPEVVGVTTLTRLAGTPPDYPVEAARKGLEGWVDIEFTVRTDGSVHEPIVRNSRPAGVFDQAAIRAVQSWRFKPVMREGRPVEQRANVRMRFSLKN
ncbi:MAG: energy transducer TonB [Proteobacteria bacterium]|nr:energy transducer TonB [Pseudomonadota bacterium]